MPYTMGDVIKSEFAGEYQIAQVDVTTDAATGNVTIAEYGEVKVIAAELVDGATTTCRLATAKENATTKNQIDIKLWKSDPVPGNEANIVAATSPFGVTRVTFLGISK